MKKKSQVKVSLTSVRMSFSVQMWMSVESLMSATRTAVVLTWSARSDVAVTQDSLATVYWNVKVLALSLTLGLYTEL